MLSNKNKLSSTIEYDLDELEHTQIFKLSNFEGPLDLLLFLIKSKKISILEVDLVKISDQYVNILMQNEDLNLDELSEYFLIASKLISIKSKIILNTHIENEKIIDSDEENLIESLLKYEKVKSASTTISKIFKELNIIDKVDNDLQAFLKKNHDFDKIIIKNTTNDLLKTIETLISMSLNEEKVINTPILKRRIFSIEDILKRLINLTTPKGITFTSLIKNKDRAYISLIFLGVLELTSKSILSVEEIKGDLYIYKNV